MADYRFRVSDAYLIPLRGWMLRLKLLDGAFEPAMLKPGSRVRLVSPDGADRVVTVLGLSATAGRQKQDRVDTYGEFDVVIPQDDALRDDRPPELGWEAVPAD